MYLPKAFLYYLFFLSTFYSLKAEIHVTTDQSDSLTLAQAFINLSLTDHFFDTLSANRVSKILLYEKKLLNSISDSAFIRSNSLLISFANSLLYYLDARHQFINHKDKSRQRLLICKNQLDSAIINYNLVEETPFHSAENVYYNFIEFRKSNVQKLRADIIHLKTKLTPYFNQDIYPDFKRIFYREKNVNTFLFDSLTRYTSLYSLPLSREILDNTGEGKTINETESEYGSILQSYPLDLPLDLISRYIQMHHLAHCDTISGSTINNSCILYVQNHIFNDAFSSGDSLFESTWNLYNQLNGDPFLNNELNELQRKNLYQRLSETVGNCFTLSEVFMVLDTFAQAETSTVSENELSLLENKLKSVQDSQFIEDYSSLYHITYSRLFYEKADAKLRYRTDTSRSTLLEWKSTLDVSINQYNQYNPFNLDDPHLQFLSPLDDSLYTYILFNESTDDRLHKEIFRLKLKFAHFFNRDIYPDFKRIFFKEKKSADFIDSLLFYTSLYDIPLSKDILDNNSADGRTNYNQYDLKEHITTEYPLHLALDLISRYLQINYITNEVRVICNKDYLINQYRAFEDDLNVHDPSHFEINTDRSDEITKDEFFRKEMSLSICIKLYKKIQYLEIHCPQATGANVDTRGISLDSDRDGPPDYMDKEPYSPPGFLFYFPIPVPFPSAYKYIPNFKPLLKSIHEVDQYISGIFNTAGYKEHTHYYYVKSGYAMSTDLEAIHKDGRPLDKDKRWKVTVGGTGELSMYEIFKSIFFATEADFRMFALVVMPSAAAMQSKPSTIGTMQDLITHSYPTLPKDLKDMAFIKKTLSLFVYHYHFSDVGEVPELDTSNRLSVDDHLKKSGLGDLLKK